MTQTNAMKAQGRTAKTQENVACIHDMFTKQARATPQAVALISKQKQYTYAELDAVTDRLAGHLRAAGVARETIVGCWLHDSFTTVICVLGILKAGGAYLLLDPHLPVERLSHMVQDANPIVIVADKQPTKKVVGGRQILRIQTLLGQIPAHPGGFTSPKVRPDDLAYVAYTSGSTGWPKGVLITHGAVVNHAKAFRALFNLVPGDRLPLLAPLAFDMATEEMIPPLVSGCTLIDEPLHSPSMQTFTHSIVRNRFTILNIPAPLWNQWTAYLTEHYVALPADLRLVIVGSDKIYTQQFKEWQALTGADRVQWVAAYGVTEATITSTLYLTAAQDDLSAEPLMPIGRAIHGVSVHVLRPDGTLTDPGEIGELYIGGAGLARGYQNLPDKTATSFIDDTQEISAGSRLYVTGDLVRQRPDGVIVWIGRKDSQIKLNGLRIEPTEIEAAIYAHPATNDAVVVFLPSDALKEGRLQAYIVPKEGQKLEDADIRQFLKKRLHPLMVPAEIVILDSMPLNANGKIDRKALQIKE